MESIVANRARLRSDPSEGPQAADSFAYIPALDGLRGLSIALVVISHFGFGKIIPGVFGVTVFFFISGFLITRLLLAEMSQTHSIALGSFYARRMLRLYPALLLMVVVSTPIFRQIGGTLTPSDLISALFYGANYHEMAGGNVSGLPNVQHPFGVLWSLAVEEHYYLFFPFFALLLGRNLRRFAICLIMLILLTTAWRFHVVAQCAVHPGLGFCAFQFRIAHGTDTRLDSILYGAVLAVLLAGRTVTATLRWLRAPKVLIASLLLLVAAFAIRTPWFRDTWRFSLQGVGLMAGVGGILYAPQLMRVRRVFEHRAVVLVGRLSYSLYLWHWIVLMLFGAFFPSLVLRSAVRTIPPLAWVFMVFPALLAASFLAAAASYFGVEQPMLRFRRRFGSHAVDSRAVAANKSCGLSCLRTTVAVKTTGAEL